MVWICTVALQLSKQNSGIFQRKKKSYDSFLVAFKSRFSCVTLLFLMNLYNCGHAKSGAVRTLGSWPDKSWKWLQKSGFFNWWNDRFIGQAHQASDDELWNWNSMEEGGSGKQVTKIKVIVFMSYIYDVTRDLYSTWCGNVNIVSTIPKIGIPWRYL